MIMRSKIALAIAALSAIQIGSAQIARACSNDPFAGTFFDCSREECELVGGGDSSTCQYTEQRKSVPEPVSAIAIVAVGAAIACSGKKQRSAK